MENILLWTKPLLEVGSRVLQNLIAFLPQIVGAVLLLLLGWIVARLLRALTLKVMSGFDRFSSRSRIAGMIPGGRVGEATARIIANVVYWIVILFFLTSATNLIGLTLFSGWLDRLIVHLPNILSGGLIIFAGVVFGGLAREAVQTAASGLQQRQRQVLGRIAQAFTLVTLTVIGADQIGIEITLLITVMAVVIGTLLGGIAIAFSIGSRTLVSNLIGVRYLSRDYRVGERIRIGDIEGVILEITAVAVVLDSAAGRVTVPAKLFSEQTSMLIGGGARDAR